jgi:hypothetical protein
MSIYHIGKTMEGIKDCLHECPTVEPHIERQQLRIAAKLFHEGFPRWEALRNAVAHSAECNCSPRRLQGLIFEG